MTKKEKKIIYLKVTTTDVYAFPDGEINGSTPQEMVDEWFNLFPIEAYHASREAYRVGGSRMVKDVEQINDKEASDYHLAVVKYNNNITQRRKANEKADGWKLW
jgi:hypothetical protein